MRNIFYKCFVVILSLFLLLGCGVNENASTYSNEIDKTSIPAYDGKTYNVELNNNETYFTDEEMSYDYNYYSLSELDDLNRCGAVMAVASKDTIASTERGSIGSIKPSGWHTVRYDGIVSEKLGYVYQRSHLGMYKLLNNLFDTNVKENLITGTRFFNANEDYGMLHFEMLALNYVKNSNYHLLYRVTPVFEDDNLIATGVIMEAKSMEDDGDSFEFCVFVYNVEPNEVDPSKLGITIDYKTGETHEQTQKEYDTLLNNENDTINANETVTNDEIKYILNTNSKKFHDPNCSSISNIKTKNKKETNQTYNELINQGYTPCQICNPQ